MIHPRMETSVSTERVKTGKRAVLLDGVSGFPMRHVNTTILPLSQGTRRLPAVVRLGAEVRLRRAA